MKKECKSSYAEDMEEDMMPLMKFSVKKTALFWLCFSLVFMMVAFAASNSIAEAAIVKQKTFASPEEAVQALVDAVRTENKNEIIAILGPGSNVIISSGDKEADKRGRERFISAYDESKRLEKVAQDKVVLHVGSNDWPFPVPIVKRGETWVFDTKTGKEEILSRRIGKNELNVINVLNAYVDAQREYASKDRDSDGILEFAQKFSSTKDKKDGLFWEFKEGEDESPLGPLAATAAREGYKKQKGSQPTPYHGYFYKILKGQGKDATGGEFDYVVNDNMVLGFALVAYPAKYGSTGIMTFIVNHEGIIYEKDIGKDTASVVQKMKRYNPDRTWKKVEEAQKP